MTIVHESECQNSILQSYGVLHDKVSDVSITAGKDEARKWLSTNWQQKRKMLV